MFVTNDVALLTVVPFTLKLNVKRTGFLIILEVLAANAMSALTPFGNPQNIFIYFYYHLRPLEFMRIIVPFALGSFCFTLFLSFFGKTEIFKKDKTNFVIQDKRNTCIYLAFFTIFILAIFKILPLWIGIIVVFYAFFRDKDSLKVDYFLLGIFLAFFGLTDNLMKILKFTFENGLQVFLTAAFTSQFISNVPSALLFADFTSDWQSLLWGVSVGGFGSLIASLASLIAYRLYRSQENYKKIFLIHFHLLSFILFFLSIGLYFIFHI